MLDAYNVFNYPQSIVSNKYNQKMRKNKKDYKSKYREGNLKKLDRNRSIGEKSNSRNNYSPSYLRDNSVVLPELSRSPGISLVSGRKKSIVSLKKKHAEKYMRSMKRNNNKISSINNSPNKSTDLESMPSISKQLDRILNSHKLSIGKSSKKNPNNLTKIRPPNHYKIKSISNEKERRELAIDGLPSAISKPGNNLRQKIKL